MKVKIYFKDKVPIVLNKIEKTETNDKEFIVTFKNGKSQKFLRSDIYRTLKRYGD